MDEEKALDLHLRLRTGNRKPNRLMGKSRAASGVINLSDARYRQAFINAYYQTVGGSTEEVERLVDAWDVRETKSDAGVRWVPFPLWDALHGYLIRPSFPTEEEAWAEVERVGGVRRRKVDT